VEVLEMIAVYCRNMREIREFDTTGGLLSWAASAYASVASAQIRGADADEFPEDMMLSEGDWPGDYPEGSWLPSQKPIENLLRSAALIVAEIERLQKERTA